MLSSEVKNIEKFHKQLRKKCKLEATDDESSDFENLEPFETSPVRTKKKNRTKNDKTDYDLKLVNKFSKNYAKNKVAITSLVNYDSITSSRSKRPKNKEQLKAIDANKDSDDNSNQRLKHYKAENSRKESFSKQLGSL